MLHSRMRKGIRIFIVLFFSVRKNLDCIIIKKVPLHQKDGNLTNQIEDKSFCYCTGYKNEFIHNTNDIAFRI